MLDRGHIERVLRLNGLEPNAPDEEIKDLLVNARWREDDVDAAIIILRSDPRSQNSNTYHIQDALLTERKLAPEMLNSLLGIDVEVNNVAERHRSALKRTYHIQLISLVLFSILAALVFLLIVVQSTGFDVLK